KALRVDQDLRAAMKGVDAVIFAVRHKPYLSLEATTVVEGVGRPAAIIDAFGVLDDDRIKDYLRMGCEVKGLGRGHIRRLKDEVWAERRGWEDGGPKRRSRTGSVS
ncbi:MAG: hypothetical protein JXP34_05925, partial [Planctomycetes bacterium]|nr:hypothetical protein [Planctomycetota bacterium]